MPYPQPKRPEKPCLVDKTVDNVDNFAGPAVDKWGPGGLCSEIATDRHFWSGSALRVDRAPSVGYNGGNGQACRTRREGRQNEIRLRLFRHHGRPFPVPAGPVLPGSATLPADKAGASLAQKGGSRWPCAVPGELPRPVPVERS